LMALSDQDWARLETSLGDLGLKMPNLDKILA